MDKTKIDWCDMSWNPITGCRHGCEYCYARRIAERFGGGAPPAISEIVKDNGGVVELSAPVMRKRSDGQMAKAPYPHGFTPTFHRYRLNEAAKKNRPRNIFVGSTADIFGRWVPTRWIAEVLDACAAGPQHNYLFLTKNPARYMELDQIALLPRESNFWYGSTVTTEDSAYFYSNNHKTFLSIEPLLGRLGPLYKNIDGVDWVIIGAMTGPGSEKHKPERLWVEEIVETCRRCGVPVFMKSNLAGVWGDDLIQEFPKELGREAGDA